MAYDFGTGFGGMFSGAGTGAALGSVVPLFGTTAGAIGGGLMGLMSGFTGEDEGFSENVNPYTQDYWDMMTGNMNNYQNQMGSALSQQQSVLANVEGLAGKISDFSPSYNYDPSAAMRMTRGQLPQLQQLAEASMGTRYGGDAESLQRQMTSAAQRTAGQFQQLGGLGSGAAAQAIGEAGANVASQRGQQQQQMYQSSLMNLLQNALGANQQGLQTQLGAEQQQDQMRLGAMQTGMSGLSDVAGQYGQRGNMYANLLQGAQQGLGGMAQPDMVYQPPSQQNIFGDMMSGLQSGATSMLLASQLNPNMFGQQGMGYEEMFSQGTQNPQQPFIPAGGGYGGYSFNMNPSNPAAYGLQF